MPFDVYTDEGHRYVSADCWHAQHAYCTASCAWCPALCACPCHDEHAAGSMGDLIAQSSLGTPEALALRARSRQAGVGQ